VTAVVVNLALAWFVQAPKRNHPLMLLSGVATNAVGFDLSPPGPPGRSATGHTIVVEVMMPDRSTLQVATDGMVTRQGTVAVHCSHVPSLNSCNPSPWSIKGLSQLPRSTFDSYAHTLLLKLTIALHNNSPEEQYSQSGHKVLRSGGLNHSKKTS
jgi:hypothetical protein